MAPTLTSTETKRFNIHMPPFTFPDINHRDKGHHSLLNSYNEIDGL